MTPKPSALAPVFENIPAELKEYPQFVVWKFTYNQKRGEYAKVPYSPLTGQPARSHNAEGKEYSEPASATWSSFSEAQRRYELGGYDGIGFVFTDDDPFVGGDIDHCLDASGALNDTATFALPFVSTYSEVSPSGTGVKFIARGTCPGNKGRKNGDVELYPNGRYFTLTGRRMADYPVTIEAADVTTLHEIWFGKELPKMPERPLQPVSPMDDTEVLKRAERDPLFDRLWRGDAGGYSSQSSADFALVGKLLYYIGEPDAARVDRLFRQSGLTRPKWDEQHGQETYGERTIRKGIEGRTEYYGQNQGVVLKAFASAIDIQRAGGAAVPTFDDTPEDEEEEQLPEVEAQYSEVSECELRAILPQVEAEIPAVSDESTGENKIVDMSKNEIETCRQNHSPASDLLDLCPLFDDPYEWSKYGRKIKRYKETTDEHVRWMQGAWCESLIVPFGGKQAFIEKLWGRAYAKTIMDTYAPTYRAWRGLGRQEGVPFWMHQELQGVKDDEDRIRWCSEYRDRSNEARQSKDNSKALTRAEVRQRLNIQTPTREVKGWRCPARAEVDPSCGELIARYAEMAGRVEAGIALKQFLKEQIDKITPKPEPTYSDAYDGIHRSGAELCQDARDYIEKNERQRLIEDGLTLQAADAILSDTLVVVAVPADMAEDCQDGSISILAEADPLDEFDEDDFPADFCFPGDELPPISAEVESELPAEKFSIMYTQNSVLKNTANSQDSKNDSPYAPMIDAAQMGLLPSGKKIPIGCGRTTDNLNTTVLLSANRNGVADLQYCWEYYRSHCIGRHILRIQGIYELIADISEQGAFLQLWRDGEYHSDPPSLEAAHSFIDTVPKKKGTWNLQEAIRQEEIDRKKQGGNPLTMV